MANQQPPEPWSWDLPQQSQPQPLAPQPQPQQPPQQPPGTRRTSPAEHQEHEAPAAAVATAEVRAPVSAGRAQAGPVAGSDPAPWLPTKVLLIITGVAVVALIVTVGVLLALWLTPPMQPMDVPTIPAG